MKTSKKAEQVWCPLQSSALDTREKQQLKQQHDFVCSSVVLVNSFELISITENSWPRRSERGGANISGQR